MSYPNALHLTSPDGTLLQAYTARPEGTGPYPGILLLQEAFGVNAHIRRVADRLAAAGYVVVAPELYHRTAAPGQEFAYADFASAVPHYHALTSAGLADTLQAAYDWLQAQPEVVAGRIGSIGFCLGGRTSFLANLVLPLAAGVSYYGGGTHLLAGRAAELHAPHLFFWAGQDEHITSAQIAETTTALDAAGKPYINTIISYARHGFNSDDRAGDYHAQAAAEAWALALAFLHERLG